MPASNLRPPTIDELTTACRDLAADLERFAATLTADPAAPVRDDDPHDPRD